MNDSARKAVNEYNRKWRSEHKDRVKEYNKRYWEKKAISKEANDAKDQFASTC